MDRNAAISSAGVEALPRRRGRLILVFFFITGLTGLAYELAWIRLLILAFGSTQFAVTTVLATFMAGLGLGSALFGRVVDRSSSPLKVYAVLEVALGLYCLVSPAVFHLVRDLYIGISGVEGAQRAGFEFSQFGLSFLALIVPTTLMGGTLPALVKYLTRASGRIGLSTAIPYSVNTLGAVFGTLFAGLFSMYFLGVKATVYTAGLVDIAVGVLVFLIYRGRSVGGDEGMKVVPVPTKTGKNLRLLIIAAFTLSGFASLAYEVLWTRLFSLVLGSSVYAFTVMLATFLAGIGVGSILFAPAIDRLKKPLFWFGLLEGVIGVSSLLSVFAYGKLPFLFYNLKEAFSEEFWLFLIVQFLLCSAIMIVPTLSMGAIFPLVGKIYTRGLKTVGKNIGDIYLFNTLGSIGGAFVGGFILIPAAGVQNGVIIMTLLNIAIAVALLNSARPNTRSVTLGAALLAAFFIVAALLPPWGKTVMTLGLYVNPAPEEARKETPELLYYRDGINAVITVRKEGPDRISYQANGKQEATSVGGKPGPAWSLLGHMPMLLHRGEPGDALLVGLGSGITLGAMEDYPLRSIDVVEIEPAVVDAASFFREANGDALSDPRVKLHITDGRSFLFAKKGKYDVIVSAVSDPWISGVSNLFTYEYFEELGNKLNDDGIVSLWFQNYRITPEELKIAVNTFSSVFPHVSIWFHYTDAIDLVIVGSKEPHTVDLEILRRRFSTEGVREGLASIDLLNPIGFFDLYLIGGEDLKRYAGTTVLNTDEKPVFEYRLPKLLYLDPEKGKETLKDVLANASDFIPPVKLSEGEEEEFYLAVGKSLNRYSFRLPQVIKAMDRVLETNPSNTEALTIREGVKKELNFPGDGYIRK